MGDRDIIRFGRTERSVSPVHSQAKIPKMAPYPQRVIGDDKVSAEGLGCMGMSQAYTSFGGYDDEESLKTLTAAADMGITFVHTTVLGLDLPRVY